MLQSLTRTWTPSLLLGLHSSTSVNLIVNYSVALPKIVETAIVHFVSSAFGQGCSSRRTDSDEGRCLGSEGPPGGDNCDLS